MNQIVKRKTNELEKIGDEDRKVLTMMLPAERKLIEAALQPKINEGVPVDVITEFIAIITTAYTRSGQTIPHDNGVTLALYAEELYNVLIEEFPRITIAEVKEAMKQGVYGRTGEFFGLNPKTFYQFVKHYLFTEERRQAKKTFEENQALIGLMAIEFTPEQQEKEDKDFVNMLYRQYRNRELRKTFFPVRAYDILEKYKVIELTKEQKRKILRRGKRIRYKQLFDEKTLKANNKLDVTAMGMGELLDRFANGTEPKEEKDAYKAIAKKISVLLFFARCNVDRKEIIF